MAIAKSKANLISIAFKSEKSDYKSDNYSESNQEKKQRIYAKSKQRRLRKIAREKLLIAITIVEK